MIREQEWKVILQDELGYRIMGKNKNIVIFPNYYLTFVFYFASFFVVFWYACSKHLLHNKFSNVSIQVQSVRYQTQPGLNPRL